LLFYLINENNFGPCLFKSVKEKRGWNSNEQKQIEKDEYNKEYVGKHMLTDNFYLIIRIGLESRKAIHQKQCSPKETIILVELIVVLFHRTANKAIDEHCEK